MLKRFKRILKNEDGQILPMFAIMLVILMGLTAITIDGGRICYLKNKSYNIAEASATSIIDDLRKGSNETTIRNTAMDYAIANGAEEGHVTIGTEYSSMPDGGEKINKVSVTVNLEHKMIFAKVIGKKDRLVSGTYSVSISSKGP